jgi:hypothetical protein
MANQYSIKIKNNSGVFRNYYIFSALPQVTPKVNGKLWSNILAVAHVQPNQSATFTIYKQYFAIVGNSSGTPAQGVMVNVSGYKDVTLGSQSPNGDLIPGTTLELDASDGAPYFTDNSVPDGGQVNAFQVKAPVGGSHFTIPDAKQGEQQIFRVAIPYANSNRQLHCGPWWLRLGQRQWHGAGTCGYLHA